MVNTDIYSDIAKRTNGELFVGVVGPVRTGKSSFIKRFAEEMMLPRIEKEYDRQRTRDELPQSAAGKTLMTAEPKFVPDEAVDVQFGDGATMKTRLVDSVGYLVPGVLGDTENGEPRMVQTPWHNKPMPFVEAAEEGTRRVIRDHSTVVMLVTSDGSFGELSRDAFVDAEKRIVAELKESGKPFCIILNSANPQSDSATALALSLEQSYGAPVALVDCLDLDAEDMDEIFRMLLDEFPIREITVTMPTWMAHLKENHPLVESFIGTVRACAEEVRRMGDLKSVFERAKMNPDVTEASVDATDYATGAASVSLRPERTAYYGALCEITGLDVRDEADLFPVICDLVKTRAVYDKVRDALDAVAQKGYGIVMPDVSELKLAEPEIVRQAGGYGVRLRASAQTLHVIRANIETDINPIVGTEQQSRALADSLKASLAENPEKIWEINLFGKSLYELVRDGLSEKLRYMPDESRAKLSETLERIINEESNGLICILL